MSAVIGPGTPLVALDGSNPHPGNPAYRLTVGAIYTVQRVYSIEKHHDCYPNCRRCGEDGDRHYVVIHQRPHWGYPFCVFRPLNDGDTSLVDAEQELEDA